MPETRYDHRPIRRRRMPVFTVCSVLYCTRVYECVSVCVCVRASGWAFANVNVDCLCEWMCVCVWVLVNAVMYRKWNDVNAYFSQIVSNTRRNHSHQQLYNSTQILFGSASAANTFSGWFKGKIQRAYAYRRMDVSSSHLHSTHSRVECAMVRTTTVSLLLWLAV